MVMPIWVMALLWLAIFVGNSLLLHWSLTRFKDQAHIAYADSMYGSRLTSPYSHLLQCVSALAIFAFVWFVDYDAFTAFYAGGWLVTAAVTLGGNLRSSFWVKTLASPGRASGCVTISTGTAWSERAYQCFGAAASCLLIGVLTAHLALFGGAFILTASGIGYWRQGRRLLHAVQT